MRAYDLRLKVAAVVAGLPEASFEDVAEPGLGGTGRRELAKGVEVAVDS